MMLSRIHLLEQRIANQIAAGEVVERPASIVKELLENCIDANATKIIIEIEKGGMSRIAIRDNGCGILKDDLALALARHATSKISTSSDLAEIKSLGFRGEALASICSVSHLSLQSRVADEDAAWQVVAEGNALTPKLTPVSHPVGTTVEVRDLFFNLPARRKFLRSEKTEFIHIEDIVKKIALSQPTLHIQLNHNGRNILNIPSVSTIVDSVKRIQAVCGSSFTSNALTVEFEATDLKLQGFISTPDYSRSQTDLQYFFLNGRVIRDRVINHAIRQAYEDIVHPGRHPCYVLYLTINPSSVDVNVHPTKHEVRFRDRHLVHDFILYRLESVLHDKPVPEIAAMQNQSVANVAAMQNQSVANVAEPVMTYQIAKRKPVVQIQHVIDNRFVLYTNSEGCFCFDMVRAIRQQIGLLSAQTVANDLMFPLRLTYSGAAEKVTGIFEKLGITASCDDGAFMIKAMPQVLCWINEAALSDYFQTQLQSVETLSEQSLVEGLSTMVANQLNPLAQSEILTLLAEFEAHPPAIISKAICHLTTDRLDALLN